MGLYKRLDFWGNLVEKSAFLASKLGNGPLLEHGPLIEILGYIVLRWTFLYIPKNDLVVLAVN